MASVRARHCVGSDGALDPGPLTFRTAPPLCYHKNAMFSSTSSFRSNHEYDLDTRAAAVHCGTLIDVHACTLLLPMSWLLNSQQ